VYKHRLSRDQQSREAVKSGEIMKVKLANYDALTAAAAAADS